MAARFEYKGCGGSTFNSQKIKVCNSPFCVRTISALFQAIFNFLQALRNPLLSFYETIQLIFILVQRLLKLGQLTLLGLHSYERLVTRYLIAQSHLHPVLD